MKKEIEKLLGSWDWEVGSFSCLVVYLERGTDGFVKAKLLPFKSSSSIF